MISVLSAMPSQWALQYFCFSGAMQLQAGFAHFFAAAMFTSQAQPAPTRESARGMDDSDAGQGGNGCRGAEMGAVLRDKLEVRSQVAKPTSCLSKNMQLSPCTQGSLPIR